MTVKRKIYIVISWLLAAACMGTIFYLSAQVAVESQAMSDSLLQKIIELLHIEFTSFIIRKFAHTFEFTVLSMLLFNAVYATRQSRLTPLWAFLITAFYAAADEFHQLFVEGRSGQLRDVLIDSCGALLGVITASFILIIIRKISERRKENGNSKTL